MRSITDEDLILMHYQELEPAAEAELRDALAQDPALAARYRALERTLAAAGDAPIPAPDAELGARVWARVEPKLGAQQRVQPMHRRAAPWLALAASAALVAIGVARWQDGRAPSAPPLVAAAPSSSAGRPAGAAEVISAAGRERVLLTRVAHHLDGSQRLFASVSNAEAGHTDADEVREWAQRALGANRGRRGGREARGRAARCDGALADRDRDRTRCVLVRGARVPAPADQRGRPAVPPAQHPEAHRAAC